MNEGFGKASFWFWLLVLRSIYTSVCIKLYGATRRISHYDASTGWHPLFVIAFVGMLLIAVGIACQVLQILVVLLKERKSRLYW